MAKWFIKHAEGRTNENVKHNKNNNKLKRNTNGGERESFCDYLRPFRNKQKLINEKEKFNGEEHESSYYLMENDFKEEFFPFLGKVNNITYILIDFSIRLIHRHSRHFPQRFALGK